MLALPTQTIRGTGELLGAEADVVASCPDWLGCGLTTACTTFRILDPKFQIYHDLWPYHRSSLIRGPRPRPVHNPMPTCTCLDYRPHFEAHAGPAALTSPRIDLRPHRGLRSCPILVPKPQNPNGTQPAPASDVPTNDQHARFSTTGLDRS